MAVNNLEQKLAQIAIKDNGKWLADAEWRKANRNWLRKSSVIALQVLQRLDELTWSQKQLAEKMGTTPQYISKLCKGQENLTLKNIAQLEDALQIRFGIENDNTHFLSGHISIQMDNSFKVAFANLMNKTNIQYDEQSQQILVSVKAPLIAPMLSKSSSPNSVKKEVEDFALSA